jgi:hypothetical protein
MLHANIRSHEGYGPADLERAQEALALLEEVVNGPAFREAVLRFDAFQFDVYEPGPGGVVRVPRPSRTNEEVWGTMLRGMRSDGTDTYMDLHLRLVPGAREHVVGSEQDDIITTYEADFERLSPGERAGHYMHEWAHALGFHHGPGHGLDPGRDCFSVPYTLGNLVVFFTTGRVPFHCVYPFLEGLPAGPLPDKRR